MSAFGTQPYHSTTYFIRLPVANVFNFVLRLELPYYGRISLVDAVYISAIICDLGIAV